MIVIHDSDMTFHEGNFASNSNQKSLNPSFPPVFTVLQTFIHWVLPEEETLIGLHLTQYLTNHRRHQSNVTNHNSES